ASQQIKKAIATVARERGSVLLVGPIGTGKHVAATALHRLSGDGPWTRVNCAAVPDDDAPRTARGTLFLDEVSDLTPASQRAMLGLIEETELRVIAAASAPLGEELRPNLRALLSDWVLHLPPLSARRADILALWDHFLAVEHPDQPVKPRATAFS